jgi:hypothetical protein
MWDRNALFPSKHLEVSGGRYTQRRPSGPCSLPLIGRQGSISEKRSLFPQTGVGGVVLTVSAQSAPWAEAD